MYMNVIDKCYYLDVCTCLSVRSCAGSRRPKRNPGALEPVFATLGDTVAKLASNHDKV